MEDPPGNLKEILRGNLIRPTVCFFLVKFQIENNRFMINFSFFSIQRLKWQNLFDFLPFSFYFSSTNFFLLLFYIFSTIFFPVEKGGKNFEFNFLNSIEIWNFWQEIVWILCFWLNSWFYFDHFLKNLKISRIFSIFSRIEEKNRSKLLWLFNKTKN